MIFKTALAAANATIENSIMIGDNFDADVMGAYHLGMKCIYYNPDHYPSTSLPKEVICINHLSDLVR